MNTMMFLFLRLLSLNQDKPSYYMGAKLHKNNE